jgi:hypothetical protein
VHRLEKRRLTTRQERQVAGSREGKERRSRKGWSPHSVTGEREGRIIRTHLHHGPQCECKLGSIELLEYHDTFSGCKRFVEAGVDQMMW